jgi:hypothetical protein
MTTFSTLSPIPGFKSWLTTEIAFSLKPAPNVAPAGPLLLSSEISTIQKAADILLGPNRPEKRYEALLGEVLDHEQWWQNNDTTELLKPILLRLGARYLVKEVRVSNFPGLRFRYRRSCHLLSVIGPPELELTRHVHHCRKREALHSIQWPTFTSETELSFIG